MLQPPFQSNKVPLPAEPPKTIAKCVYFAKKRLEVHVVSLRSSSEPLSAIFLRLPGLAPDRRGSKEGDHPTIYIASDRFEIRSITVGLAGARPNQSKMTQIAHGFSVLWSFFVVLVNSFQDSLTINHVNTSLGCCVGHCRWRRLDIIDSVSGKLVMQ